FALRPSPPGLRLAGALTRYAVDAEGRRRAGHGNLARRLPAVGADLIIERSVGHELRQVFGDHGCLSTGFDAGTSLRHAGSSEAHHRDACRCKYMNFHNLP